MSVLEPPRPAFSAAERSERASLKSLRGRSNAPSLNGSFSSLKGSRKSLVIPSLFGKNKKTKLENDLAGLASDESFSTPLNNSQDAGEANLVPERNNTGQISNVVSSSSEPQLRSQKSKTFMRRLTTKFRPAGSPLPSSPSPATVGLQIKPVNPYVSVQSIPQQNPPRPSNSSDTPPSSESNHDNYIKGRKRASLIRNAFPSLPALPQARSAPMNSAFSDQNARAAALRERGLLPQLSLSQQEAVMDAQIATSVPSDDQHEFTEESRDKASSLTRSDTAAARVKAEWEARNREAEEVAKARMKEFRFGGDSPTSTKAPGLSPVAEISPSSPSPASPTPDDIPEAAEVVSESPKEPGSGDITPKSSRRPPPPLILTPQDNNNESTGSHPRSPWLDVPLPPSMPPTPQSPSPLRPISPASSLSNLPPLPPSATSDRTAFTSQDSAALLPPSPIAARNDSLLVSDTATTSSCERTPSLSSSVPTFSTTVSSDISAGGQIPARLPTSRSRSRTRDIPAIAENPSEEVIDTPEDRSYLSETTSRSDAPTNDPRSQSNSVKARKEPIKAKRRSILNPFKRSQTLGPESTGDGKLSTDDYIRRSVTSKGRPKSSLVVSTGEKKGFNASHLPPSPNLPSTFAESEKLKAQNPQSLQNGDVNRRVSVFAKSQNRKSMAPADNPRQALKPTLHSHATILHEMGEMEDDESKRLAEMAFLG